MSKLHNISKWPILLNVNDLQREELKKEIGHKFNEFSQSKTFSEGHNPMDLETWDHWTISNSDGEGFKLGTVNNIMFLMSSMDEYSKAYEPVSFEVFKFICLSLTIK